MKINRKIKQIRESLGMSIRDVHSSLETMLGKGVAPSYRTLLRLEQGQAIKFTYILQLCMVFHMPIVELLKDTEFQQGPVIRKKERTDSYCVDESVFKSDTISTNKQSFLCSELTIMPHKKTGVEQSNPEKGKCEKWVYVLKGILTCIVGTDEYILKSGDTIGFDGCIEHFFENNTKESCMCIVVKDPKGY